MAFRLLTAAMLIAASAAAAESPARSDESADVQKLRAFAPTRRLDPPPTVPQAIWEQLSTTGQVAAWLRFEHELGLSAPADALEPAKSVAPAAPQQPAALANNLVNDVALDTTVQDTQSEAVVLRIDPSIVLVAFNDSGSNVGGGSHFTGWARSTDGGASFTDRGTLPNSSQGDAGNPVFGRDAVTGRIYLATLGFNSAAQLPVFRSDDGGLTLAAPVNAFTTGIHDRPWLAVDNAAGAGQGNVYVMTRDFGTGGGMRFTRSIDAGASYSAGLLLTASSGNGAFIAVGADHSVYAFYLDTGNVIRVRRSTTLGTSFAVPATVRTLASTGVNGDLGLEHRTNGFPQCVADPVIAARLFCVYADRGTGGDRANIVLVASADSGATWPTQLQVNTDATANDQVSPNIAITPDGTRVFVGWYDRRDDPGNQRIEYWGRVGTTGASPPLVFGPDFPISTAPFPIVIGQDPALITNYMGDYDVASADNQFFYVGWGDNRGASAAHAHQPDVRFAKIPVAGPGLIATALSQAVVAESCPANNAPDPGETVTMSLCLANIGTGAPGNLVGTLLPGGGILAPGAPQSFGAVAPGATACRPFTFRLAGFACGTNATATLALADGALNEGALQFAFALGFPNFIDQAFTNSGAITINDNAAATPYPASVTVSGVPPGATLSLVLRQLAHTFPDDIDVLLVAPGGQKFKAMSDVGGGGDVASTTLTLADAADAALGNEAMLVPGTFRPTDVNDGSDFLPAPAPAGPYASPAPTGSATLADTLPTGAAANGTWSLYVRDDTGQDAGSFAGGFTLSARSGQFECACSAPGTLFFDGFE